jgi:hypothetical protein
MVQRWMLSRSFDAVWKDLAVYGLLRRVRKQVWRGGLRL